MSTQVQGLLSLDDAALTKLYAERIEPILKGNEAERLKALSVYKLRVALGIVAAAAVGAGSLWVGQDSVNALIFAGIAFAGAHWFAYRPLKAVGTATKIQFLQAVAGAIDCRFQLDEFEPDALQRFLALDLLPSSDRSTFQDCFQGSYQGCAFSFYDAHLERKIRTQKSSHWQTVFRGQLVRVAFPKKFQAVTVVRRDFGVFNMFQRWTTRLQRVGLADSRLEKAFEVYSDDQVEARYLIHPVFMERLLALETAFKGKNLRCAFEHGDLLIAVEGGDKFELGSMFSRLDDVGRARRIIADIAEVMRLIDSVLTSEDAVLPEEPK